MQLNPTDITFLLKTYGSRESFRELSNAVGQERFLEYYLPFVERVASRLSEIPLREDAFARKGGALACALKAGLLAVRLCDKTIFEPTATAQRRMIGDVQYRWLSYCATLATVYILAATAIQIEFDDGEIYSFASSESLVDLRRPYEVFWKKGPSPVIQNTYVLLMELFFSGQFAELSPSSLTEFSLAINPALQASPNEPPLARVVRTAVDKTIEDDQANTARQVADGAGDPYASRTPAQQADAPASRTEAQGEIWPSASPTSELKVKVDESPQRRKAIDWLRGLAAMDALREEVMLLPDGTLSLKRKALSFGAAARDNYQMLFDANLVQQKIEGGVICTHEACSLYKSAFPNEVSEVQP